jgi:hypothetical protein
MITDNDWEAFANAIIDNSNSATPTPQEYYNYYNWENIVKNAIGSLADLSSRHPKDH